MNLTTKRQIIDGIADHWGRQYPKKDGTLFDGRRVGDIESQLRALPPGSPESAVVAIIGASWTRMQCDECGQECDAYVRVGQEPDYESRTAYLCETCAKAAAASFANT